MRPSSATKYIVWGVYWCKESGSPWRSIDWIGEQYNKVGAMWQKAKWQRHVEPHSIEPILAIIIESDKGIFRAERGKVQHALCTGAIIAGYGSWIISSGSIAFSLVTRRPKPAPNHPELELFFFFWQGWHLQKCHVNTLKYLNSYSPQNAVLSPVCRPLKHVKNTRLFCICEVKAGLEPRNTDRNWALLCSRQENKVTCSAVRLASWYLFCLLSCLHSRMNKWSGSYFCYTASKLLKILWN